MTVSTFDVYGWNGPGPVVATHFASGLALLSPTHAYAVVIAPGVLWVAAALLRHACVRPLGSWILLVVGLAGLAGAKATFVPMFAAAAACVLVVRSLTLRRLDRTAAGLLAVTLLVGAGAWLLLYRGTTAGMDVDLAGTARLYGPRLGFGRGEDWNRSSLLSSTLTFAVAWGLAGAGMLGFLRRPAWRDPAVPLVGGFVLAGLVATFVLNQYAGSQVYFARAAFPFAVVGTAWGLTLLVGSPLRRMAVAFGSGLGLAWVVNQLSGTRPAGAVGWESTWPWLAVIAGAVLVALILSRTGPRLGLTGAAALAVVVTLGAGSLAVPTALTHPRAGSACPDGPVRTVCGVRQIPDGGELAARFVRDHSRPGDVVATNAHCAPAYDASCDTRAFWLSAYSERRVLLEGWSYTPSANALAALGGPGIFDRPFRDPALQYANDVVFTHPARSRLEILRNQYGVRWLVLDRKVAPAPAALGRLVQQRFTAGSVVVYELVL